MRPVAQLLGQGERLHLQHGPIDLIIGADGDRAGAFDAAKARFETVLAELMTEIDVLLAPVDSRIAHPSGETARRMTQAAWHFRQVEFVTAMAGVAGAVAETVLAAMTAHTHLRRAYVNNGGDIALHLTPHERFRTAIMGHDGQSLGLVEITYNDPIRGIATSGRHGRSLSRGIADSVTVLAPTATVADVSATLIANAVDLPNHPAIRRAPAQDCDDTSDLGARLVVTGCGNIDASGIQTALANGACRAQHFVTKNHIAGAFLHLAGQSCVTGHAPISLSQGTLEYA